MTGRTSIGQALLFAGAVRPTPLLKAAGRNVLDLPLSNELSVGQAWMESHRQLCQWLGASPPMRVLTDLNSPKPRSISQADATVEPDDVAFLGTGGVLRAAAKGYDGLILVATGGSMLTRPLTEVVERLLDLDADVALMAEQDGTPTGIMLVSAEVIRSLSGAGYMDFKEQCLPKIAERHRVCVAFASAGQRVCLPIRNREQYLAALSARCSGQPFVIVEDGAEVSPSARLRDAVVFRGARVGERAVVARSILGPGATVPAQTVLTDRSVGGSP